MELFTRNSGDTWWEAWQDLVRRPAFNNPMDGMIIDDQSGFETVSSSFIALPRPHLDRSGDTVKPQWPFAAGRPDKFPYQPVAL